MDTKQRPHKANGNKLIRHAKAWKARTQNIKPNTSIYKPNTYTKNTIAKRKNGPKIKI